MTALSILLSGPTRSVAVSVSLALSLVLGAACSPPIGTLQVYAEMQENPGNVTVSADGRVFASIHQFRPGSARLVEVMRDGTLKPFPNAAWNANDGSNESAFQAILGVQIDGRNRLWALDNGLGPGPRPPRLFAFDVSSGKLVMQYEFPADVAPAGSFLNDLAVDADSSFVYIADIGGATEPGIVVVNFSDASAVRSHRFDGHKSFVAAEHDVVVDLKSVKMGGQPARIGINPITVSADYSTVYFGPMSGTIWYQVAAKSLQTPGATEDLPIYAIGPKPVSDGASTDRKGRHYFTNLANNSIDIMERQVVRTLVKDDTLLNWPDALSFDDDGWLYVATNRLHLSPPLNGGTEGAPDGGFYIVRIYTGAAGVAGR